MKDLLVMYQLNAMQYDKKKTYFHYNFKQSLFYITVSLIRSPMLPNRSLHGSYSVLLCTHTQSLLSTKIIRLQEGLFVTVYFTPEAKQQFE